MIGSSLGAVEWLPLPTSKTLGAFMRGAFSCVITSSTPGAARAALASIAVMWPFGDIVVDRGATSQVDWEVELGVVIGVGGKNIARKDALTHVFGYTVMNDVTWRDVVPARTRNIPKLSITSG